MRIRIRKGIIAIALCTSMILSNINYTGATISDNNSDIHTDENNSGEDKGTVSGNPADESGQPTDDNSTSDGNLDDAPAEEPKDESPVEAPVDISDNEIPLISDIPSDDEEAEDENQNTYSYDDEKIHVEVTVYDNAFDEGIVPELKVDEITEEEQPDKYEEVKNDLQEQFPDEDIKEQKETFKSYDIHFEVDGQEVEPMGGASVSMTFHEALKPDGITEDTQISLIHHVEEKQEENIESKVEVVEDVTIQQNNAEVKAVEFTTETFSTFTIKWGNSVSLSVVCVDSKGFELHESKKPNAINLNQNHKLDINNSNIQINGYTFVVAKVFDDDISSNEEHRTLAATNGYGTEIKRLRRQDNKIKYSTSLNGDWNWTDLPSDKKVYFIYNMTEECIDTVNSKDKGVTINMFDYDAGTYADLTFSNSSNTNGYTGQGGGVTQDLVNKTLENGYPKRGNKSLNILFDPNTSNKFKGESNYLFSQEIYDQTKYFEYDSENNFAHYDEDEDRFYVYDRVGGYTDQNNNGRGEFYPYNTLGNQFVSGKQIYQVNGAPNYYFGMTVMTSFIQPRNGKVDRYVNGIKTDMEDMIFEFSGDDDVWIFIDDVLVLDMGGVHEARWGSINFSTGTVWVDRVYNNGANNNPVTTTIRQRFTQAGKDVSGWKNDNGQSINTFSDYTEHTMKIFYLERGSGASNCKLKFNIPTIPTNRIDVTKEVAGEHNTVETDETFKFQLFTKAIGSNRYVLNKGKEYSVIKKDNSTEEEIGNGTINSEGIFELHQGETARFLDIPAGTKYYVKEVRINDEKYNKVTVISGNTEKVVQISDSIQEVASNENLDPEIIKEVKFINYQKAVTFGRDKIAKLVNWDDRTYNITLTVSANTTNMKGIADKVTVTDILDDRFEFTNDIADGIIDTNNNKKITWTTAESDWAEVDGYSVWTKTFKIKAKDTYAGGNVVPTNHSLSGVVINGWGRNGTDLEMKFPEPMVNVKASVNAEDAKNVFFLGEKIGDVYKDEGAFKKAFGVSENLTGITFTYKENEKRIHN